MLKIKRVDNGYVIKHIVESKVVSNQVVEFAASDDGEVEAMQYLLWLVNEAIGPATTRYSGKRISIQLVPGDKFEDGSEEENE